MVWALLDADSPTYSLSTSSGGDVFYAKGDGQPPSDSEENAGGRKSKKNKKNKKGNRHFNSSEIEELNRSLRRSDKDFLQLRKSNR